MSLFARPRLLAGAVAALSLLAACNGESATPEAGSFKPVPVNPVVGDVVMGSETAPVTILEYAAYSCSHCRDFWKQDFPRLKETYIDTGKVKYIYRDYPIDNQGFGVLLSSVVRCGGKDKYYTMVDEMFTRQGDILDAASKGAAGPIIAEIAEKNGISRDETRTCIDHQPDLSASIIKSRDEGSARGVSSTPTVFVNDVRVEDHTFGPLSAIIEAALAGKPAPAQAAAPAGTTTPAATTPAAPAPGATPPAKPPSE